MPKFLVEVYDEDGDQVGEMPYDSYDDASKFFWYWVEKIDTDQEAHFEYEVYLQVYEEEPDNFYFGTSKRAISFAMYNIHAETGEAGYAFRCFDPSTETFVLITPEQLIEIRHFFSHGIVIET